MEKYLDNLMQLAITYAPKVLMALLVLLVGMKLINFVLRILDKTMEKTKVDDSLRTFSHSVSGVLLKALLLISVASMVGIATTSFVAILGALGLAIGLALQGSLSNFAGGVLILVFKPFKVGDYIEIDGNIGHVVDILIFNTIIRTLEHKTIILPNGTLANGCVTNYSTKENIRIDITFGIGYGDNIGDARDIILAVADTIPTIQKDPAPVAVVAELGDNSVNLQARVWSNVNNYWDIYFQMNEKVKIAFDGKGITIPFPQRDVHLFEQKPA